MYGLTFGLGSIGDATTSWLPPSQVLGLGMLGLFLVLHIVIVRAVIRPLDDLDRFGAPRHKPGRRLIVDKCHAGRLDPKNIGKLPIIRSFPRASPHRDDDP
jgi:hypothetical protein